MFRSATGRCRTRGRAGPRGRRDRRVRSPCRCGAPSTAASARRTLPRRGSGQSAPPSRCPWSRDLDGRAGCAGAWEPRRARCPSTARHATGAGPPRTALAGARTRSRSPACSASTTPARSIAVRNADVTAIGPRRPMSAANRSFVRCTTTRRRPQPPPDRDRDVHLVARDPLETPEPRRRGIRDQPTRRRPQRGRHGVLSQRSRDHSNPEHAWQLDHPRAGRARDTRSCGGSRRGPGLVHARTRRAARWPALQLPARY